MRIRGFALGVVLLVLTLVATLATVTAGLGAATLQGVRDSELQLALVHAANGGLHELMDALYGSEAYASDGFGTYTASVGSLAYRWTFDSASGQPYCTNNLAGETAVTGWGGRPVPPGTALLAVTASHPESSATAGVGAVVVNDYPCAVVADGVLRIGDVLSRDHLMDAHVRSNLEGGRPNVSGDLVEGQSFSRDGVGSIQVEGDGLRHYDEPEVVLPQIPLHDLVASYSAAGAGGGHPHGGPARFLYDRSVTAETDREGIVTIGADQIGPGETVHVDGDLTFPSGPTVAAGTRFFVDGDVRVNGALTQLAGTGAGFLVATGSILLNGGSASRMHLLAVEEITQNGASDWRGLIYVQEGRLRMNGSQSLEGVVIASAGDVLSGNADLLYDPKVLRDLSDLGLGVGGLVRTRSWWLF